jgi:hypothetical protein
MFQMLRHRSRIHSREKVVHMEGPEKSAGGAGEKHQHESEN